MRAILKHRRLALLAGLLAVVCAAAAGHAASARPPNILFLFSDDQRFDTIHALGNREIETPNLDRLARNGFAFTHAFVMGSMHGAVCVPSRAMLMTGRSLFRAGTTPAANTILPAAPLWPRVFSDAGYQAIGLGKWHNDRASFNRAFDIGGPVFFGGMSDHTRVPVFDFDRSGQYPRSLVRTGAVFATELFARAAVQFLREQRDTPFALYVAFTAPHDPRTPPEEFAKKYAPEKIELPKNFLPEHPFDNGELDVRDEKLLPRPRAPEAVRQEIAAYYGMISHLDQQIGDILAALEETGHARHTLVVFAADNGLAVGRHGLLGKQNLYDHSVRVPLLLSGPGIPKGRKSDALVYLFDLFPTLCELAGVAVPASVEGKSLVPVLKGRQPRVRDAVFGAYRDVQRSARDERWKLIWYPVQNRYQLFDLPNDPDEITDLSGDPKHAGKLAELRAKLTALQLEFGDPLVSGPVKAAQRRAPPRTAP